MEYACLFDLIQSLQYGTNLHIGILFFQDYGNKACTLPFRHTIHSREVCDELKGKSKNAFRWCFQCRKLAIRKALTQRKPFGGLCINGVYEYTHPVVIRDEVVCIICIGNILDNGIGRERLTQRLGSQTQLLQTMEETYSEEACAMTARVLESYIRFLLETYGCRHQAANPLIENLKSYLDANFEYDISLAHISALFHYNQQYLGRLFKKETGCSFSEYLTQRRIQRAKLLLECSNDPISDIAARVGYNNIPYFNRQFKQAYGMTPSQCRKKQPKGVSRNA